MKPKCLIKRAFRSASPELAAFNRSQVEMLREKRRTFGLEELNWKLTVRSREAGLDLLRDFYLADLR